MSKTNGWTPGPWIARPTAGHDKHGQSVVYPEADGRDIAIVYDGDVNAQLIAAAPELVAALQKLMNVIGDIDEDFASRDSYKQAEAALRKAGAL